MEDSRIVDLYWARDERAIVETEHKYRRILFSLSYNILASNEDCEECLNDTYLAAWNAMPEARPNRLGAFLSRITRNLAIDRYRHLHRQKRGNAEELIEELTVAAGGFELPEEILETERLREALNRFVKGLDRGKRQIFVLRYFYMKPQKEIAKALGISEADVKMSLYRTRLSLKAFLEKEDLWS